MFNPKPRSLAMQVLFQSRDTEGNALREQAVRRVQFVLRRLSWLVPKAKVQLSDINGPGGGVDKRCQVEFKTRKTGVVIITAMARDWHTALDTALARAARALVRSLQRSRSTAIKPQRQQGRSTRQLGLG
jgi:ribosome-associated translation inhibitor RaiA